MLRFRDYYHGILDRFGALLYPHGANCLCCGHPRLASPDDSLCETCRAELKRLAVPAEACDRCLSYLPRGESCPLCASPAMRDIEKVYAPYCYRGAVRDLVHAFKFRLCDEAAVLLAERMAEALIDRRFDCLTPVPMSMARLRTQGKNHAEVLARLLSEATGIPVKLLLRRDAFHQKQSNLRGEARRRNVEGAFSLAENAEGMRVLLIDDVRTTGSTAAACAKVLKAHGAAGVSLCTAAVVYSRHPGQGSKADRSRFFP